MPGATHQPELIVGISALVEFLTKRGYRITYTTAARVCSPKIDRGPPREGFFGNRLCFDPGKAIAWYRSRVTPERSLLTERRRPKTREERQREKERRRERKAQSAPQSEQR